MGREDEKNTSYLKGTYTKKKTALETWYLQINDVAYPLACVTSITSLPLCCTNLFACGRGNEVAVTQCRPENSIITDLVDRDGNDILKYQ
jgi:hypothetical protein